MPKSSAVRQAKASTNINFYNFQPLSLRRRGAELVQRTWSKDFKGRITAFIYYHKLSEGLDLLKILIGWIKDIVDKAAKFARQFNTKRIMPVHYWSDDEKIRFIEKLNGKDSIITNIKDSSEYYMFKKSPQSGKEIINLTPGEIINKQK